MFTTLKDKQVGYRKIVVYLNDKDTRLYITYNKQSCYKKSINIVYC